MSVKKWTSTEERRLRRRMKSKNEHCDDCGRPLGAKSLRHFGVMWRPMVLLCTTCEDLRFRHKYKSP